MMRGSDDGDEPMKTESERHCRRQSRSASESGSARLALAVIVGVLGVAMIAYWLASSGLGGPDTGEITAEMHRSYQDDTMYAMREIANANGRMRVAVGHYATTLDELAAGGHIDEVPSDDGWGNPFVYTLEAGTYTLVSYGSDGSPGPDPPDEWMLEPYEVDIVMVDALFTQGPRGQ